MVPHHSNTAAGTSYLSNKYISPHGHCLMCNLYHFLTALTGKDIKSPLLLYSNHNTIVLLNLGQTGAGGDTALVLPVLTHSDISLLSPAGTPGVLYQPISWSIADNQNSMVQLGAATCWFVENTTAVCLQRKIWKIHAQITCNTIKSWPYDGCMRK